MTAIESAPAKVNLCLHVTGQRPDGYHLLDSYVVFTEACDTVSARASAGLTLSITGPEADGLSAGDDNLVLRAARLMDGQNLALTLDKHLPRAAGLGGGSSDAAATLRLVARLTSRPLPDTGSALRLGADVPVCLIPRPMRMRGIGERLDPLPALPGFALVLVNPRVEIPTPQVFQALTHRKNPPLPETPAAWPDAASLFGWLRAQRNDLQAPAIARAPVIGNVLASLQAAPGCALARMSGSGATCFGLFGNLTQAQAVARRLQAAYPAWWVKATRAMPV